jgi:hypothetical protein
MSPPPASVVSSVGMPSLGNLKLENAPSVSVNEVTLPMSDILPAALDQVAKPESTAYSTLEEEKKQQRNPHRKLKKNQQLIKRS